MVKEISVLRIDGTKAEQFEEVYREIAPILRRQSGYQYDELLRVVENPDEYILIIHWKDVESHQRFIDSRDFPLIVDTWGRMQKEAVVRHCVVVDTDGRA